MLFHQACKKIVGAHVMIFIGAGLQIAAQLPDDCLMVAYKIGNHLARPGIVVRGFLELGGVAEFDHGAECPSIERAAALRNLIDDFTEFGVLLLEKLVQVVELRSGDVPMVGVRLEIQRVGIGQKTR